MLPSSTMYSLSRGRVLLNVNARWAVCVRAISLPAKAPSVKDSATSTNGQSPTPVAASSVPASLVAQAPNFPNTWSVAQRPRLEAYTDVRFEQTALEFQPRPLSAIQLVNDEPVRMIHGRKAVCDGGWGPLGHPKIFINLDKPGTHACGYCGIRFEQAPQSH